MNDLTKTAITILALLGGSILISHLIVKFTFWKRKEKRLNVLFKKWESYK